MSVQINTALKTFCHSGLKTNCETKPKSHSETCCCALVSGKNKLSFKKEIISGEFLQQRKCNYIHICKKKKEEGTAGGQVMKCIQMHAYILTARGHSFICIAYI